MLIQEMVLSSSSGDGDLDVLMCNRDEGKLLNFSQLAAAEKSDQVDDYLDNIETSCSRLLQNCLRFVDKEASAVLQLDEMEDLDVDTFRLILSRLVFA